MQLQTAKSTGEKIHKDAVILVDTAIEEIKSIATNQGSFLLKNKLLKDVLTDLIQQMKGNKKIELSLSDYGLNEKQLGDNQKINVLRIIQELLNNTIKHSQAKNCFISIKTTKNKLLLAVTDNGIGMSFKNINNGNGLKNIKNKVILMNGVKRTFSIPNKGLKIHIQI